MPKSSTRVIDILEALAAQSAPMTHAELSAALRIPKSSLSALLSDLEERGFARFDEATNRYALGPGVMALAHAFMERLDIVRFGRPVLSEIIMRVDEATALALIEGHHGMVVAQEPSSRPGSPQTMTVGARAPLSTTSAGKIMLAYLPAAQRARLIATLSLPRTARNSITDSDALMREVESVREKGIAYSREEAIDGIIAVGVPVYGADGQVVAALSTATPVHRFTPEAENEIITALREGAERLTVSLGGRTNRTA